MTGAEMLSVAAFLEGRHAQAFPSFGSERTGAPVVAFCRIADKEIRLREPILEPDCLIVQDPTLFKVMDVFAGLKPGGYLLVNSNKTFADLHIQRIVDGLPAGHAVIVPATELAQKHVGPAFAERGAARRFRGSDQSRPFRQRQAGHRGGFSGQNRRGEHCRLAGSP